MAARHNVGGFERGLSMVTGAVALARGLTGRSGPSLLLAAAGGYLLYRGASGSCVLYRALGKAGSEIGTVVAVCSQITIERPIEEVYSFLRDPRHLPQFSRRIGDVEEVSGRQWLVSARLPFGRSARLPVNLTVDERPSQLAWCTDEAADVHAAFAVSLQRADGAATEVRVDGWFQAPQLEARLLRRAERSRPLTRAGLAPSKALEHELLRLRQLLEAGEVATVRGQSAGASRAERAERHRERSGIARAKGPLAMDPGSGK